MKYKDENVMSSLRVPANVMRFYKKTAAERNVPVGDVYNEALKWYMKQRRKNNNFYHLMSSSNDQYRSLWIRVSTIKEAQRMADKDGSSLNSVTFSAIVVFYYRSQEGTLNAENIVLSPVK